MSSTESHHGRAELARSRIPWARTVLQAVILAATLLGMLSVRWADGEPSRIITFLVMVLAAFAASRPDSFVGALVVVVILLNWVSATNSPELGWSLVPALCLLTVHAGLSALSVTSPHASLPARSLARWAAQVGVVASATVVVWLLSQSLADLGARGSELLTGVGLAFLVGTAVTLGQRAVVKER